MNKNDDLIKKADIDHIVKEGSKIYEKIKGQYEPKYVGKFLAIDITTKKSYLAETSAEGVEKAREAHPDTVFYVVKIGYEVTESFARMSRREIDRLLADV
jgi:hypothetical protein